jgi:macrolide-specific efflux system membrane fusion protein
VAAGAIVAGVLLVGPSSASSSVQYSYVTVERGVVQASESASGNLSPASESDLNFTSSGILTHLYVSAGEHVGAGKLLATIDPTDAQVALEEAQANLEVAEANLAETEADPSAASTGSGSSGSASAASAKATDDAVGDTGASGTTAPSGTTSATGTTSSTGTTSASDSTGSGGSGTGKSKSSTAKSSSSGSTDSAVTTATDDANIDSAEATVSSDELTVKTDETALAGTKLYAPTAGTIASISGAIGDEVTAGSGSSSASTDAGSDSSGSSSTAASTTSSSSSSSSASGFIVLADLSSMQLEVSVSESDIGDIKVGEPATVSPDALTGQEFAAKVTAISVLSSDSSGVVSYSVTLQLTQSSSELRDGMSATATIIDKQVNNAINVESSAISSAGSGSTVTVVRNGKMVITPVITGLVGSSTTQIVAGLSVGEELAIRQSTSIATATGTSSSSSTGTLGGSSSGLGGGGGLPSGGGFGP